MIQSRKSFVASGLNVRGRDRKYPTRRQRYSKLDFFRTDLGGIAPSRSGSSPVSRSLFSTHATRLRTAQPCHQRKCFRAGVAERSELLAIFGLHPRPMPQPVIAGTLEPVVSGGA